MREQTENITVALDIVNPITGETFSTHGQHNIHNKYYSIKKLNFKGSIMDLFTYQSKLCKSSKDITIFRDLLFTVDKQNEFRANITKFAEQTGSSRQRITKLLKDAVDIGFMHKQERGVYLVNPFAFKSKGSTNEVIEKLQQHWLDITI